MLRSSRDPSLLCEELLAEISTAHVAQLSATNSSSVTSARETGLAALERLLAILTAPPHSSGGGVDRSLLRQLRIALPPSVPHHVVRQGDSIVNVAAAYGDYPLAEGLLSALEVTTTTTTTADEFFSQADEARLAEILVPCVWTSQALTRHNERGHEYLGRIKQGVFPPPFWQVPGALANGSTVCGGGWRAPPPLGGGEDGGGDGWRWLVEPDLLCDVVDERISPSEHNHRLVTRRGVMASFDESRAAMRSLPNILSSEREAFLTSDDHQLLTVPPLRRYDRSFVWLSEKHVVTRRLQCRAGLLPAIPTDVEIPVLLHGAIVHGSPRRWRETVELIGLERCRAFAFCENELVAMLTACVENGDKYPPGSAAGKAANKRSGAWIQWILNLCGQHRAVPQKVVQWLLRSFLVPKPGSPEIRFPAVGRYDFLERALIIIISHGAAPGGDGDGGGSRGGEAIIRRPQCGRPIFPQFSGADLLEPSWNPKVDGSYAEVGRARCGMVDRFVRVIEAARDRSDARLAAYRKVVLHHKLSQWLHVHILSFLGQFADGHLLEGLGSLRERAAKREEQARAFDARFKATQGIVGGSCIVN